VLTSEAANNAIVQRRPLISFFIGDVIFQRDLQRPLGVP
jgi:hypothetical protein